MLVNRGFILGGDYIRGFSTYLFTKYVQHGIALPSLHFTMNPSFYDNENFLNIPLSYHQPPISMFPIFLKSKI